MSYSTHPWFNNSASRKRKPLPLDTTSDSGAGPAKRAKYDSLETGFSNLNLDRVSSTSPPLPSLSSVLEVEVDVEEVTMLPSCTTVLIYVTFLQHQLMLAS
jgi:hypothetical protein